MRIISEQQPTLWNAEVICPYCNAHLGIDKDDLKYDQTLYFVCLSCDNIVTEIMQNRNRRESFPLIPDDIREKIIRRYHRLDIPAIL